jgi:hypothetical protein
VATPFEAQFATQVGSDVVTLLSLPLLTNIQCLHPFVIWVFFGKKFEMLMMMMMMMMKCARARLSLSPCVIILFRSSVFLSGDILPFFNKEIGKFLEFFVSVVQIRLILLKTFVKICQLSISNK